jgi:multidrug transporter EmrE-like cation transporter
MNLVSFSLVLAGVLLNAAAQLLLKAGTNHIGVFAFTPDNILPIGLRLAGEPFVLGGMMCYAISLVVWIMALSRAPVSIAYPMLSIGYVQRGCRLVPFGEAVTAQRMVGIATIIVGVFLVARS